MPFDASVLWPRGSARHRRPTGLRADRHAGTRVLLKTRSSVCAIVMDLYTVRARLTEVIPPEALPETVAEIGGLVSRIETALQDHGRAERRLLLRGEGWCPSVRRQYGERGVCLARDLWVLRALDAEGDPQGSLAVVETAIDAAQSCLRHIAAALAELPDDD